MRFLLALVLVGVAVYFITTRAPSPLARSSVERDTSSATANQPSVRGSANEVHDSVARAGETLKEKARLAGERIDDARVIAVIKSKFALDKDLSAGAISVSCQDGRVVLDGTVATQPLADRAVQLAQSTEAVRSVTSHLTVGTEPAR